MTAKVAWVPGASDDDAEDEYYLYEDDEPVQAHRQLVDQESEDAKREGRSIVATSGSDY